MTPSERRHAILVVIAAQLELRRAEKALKQYVIAMDAKMSAGTVRRIMLGHDHHISKLVDLADSMGCDVDITIRPR